MKMKKLLLMVVVGLMSLTAMTAQAQVDFKLYFANNIGDVARVSRISDNDTQLKWQEVSDGTIASNLKDVNDVKKMFREKRQKTRADQQLFWKMRDDNLLCFRINDGKAKSGEYEVSVMTKAIKNKKSILATGYFFVNTHHDTDTLLVTLNKKGCSANKSDTLHFTYYVYDWDNDNLRLFKLDSRRQKTGLTYLLEYQMQDLERNKKSTGYRELSGKSFQSILIPEDSILTDVFLVSNGQRMKLNMERILSGANLSDKLDRLWLNANFKLDKHENRELTMFNMLGTGLFEKYDTLYLSVMSKQGYVAPTSVDPKTKLAGGFSFNIAEVDANGKYVTSATPMSYVGYDDKRKKHKILTYGRPCYIEVFAPGCMPGLFKFAGAVDPGTNELNAKRTTGTVYLAEGTPTATGPDFSQQTISVLKTTKDEKLDGNETHAIFDIVSEDMNTKPSSGIYDFVVHGGDPGKKWIKSLNQYVTEYARVSVAYSVPKAKDNGSNVASLVMEDIATGTTTKEMDKISTDVINGNDYPTLTRSWYTVNFNLGTLNSSTSGDYVMVEKVKYKPRLTIGGKRFDQVRYLRRQNYTIAQLKADAEAKANDYAFNKSKIDWQFNGWQGFTILGTLAKLDLRAGDFPGLSLVVAPNIDPLRGLYEFDINFSLGWRQKNKDGGKTTGQWMRENLKEQDRLKRFKIYEFNDEHDYNIGLNVANSSKTSFVTKDTWIQSELDDIFRVEANKLGWGPSVDVHFGFGWKAYGTWMSGDNNSGQSWHLKGLDGSVSFGAYAAGRLDPMNVSEKLENFPIRFLFYGVATAQVRLNVGIKTYNFKKDGAISHRSQGFFLNAFGEVKAGAGAELKMRIGSDDTTENLPGEEGATIGQTINRLFGISAGFRAGAKVKLGGGIVKLFDRDRLDRGGSFLAIGACEGYADFRIGPFARWNPRISTAGAFFKAWPDDDSNPSIPTYPNYPIKHDENDYLNAPRRAAQELPVFPLGSMMTDALTHRAHPLFMGDSNFVMAQSTDNSNPNKEHVKYYTLPTDDGATIAANDGQEMKSNGHFTQNHHAVKAGPAEMVVYEEMTHDFSQEYLENEHGIETDLDQLRFTQIASTSRVGTDGQWKKRVVAYNEHLQDLKPVTAVNVIYNQDETVSVSDDAACLWKRGEFVLPDYADANATAEENAAMKEKLEKSVVRSFQGDLMLSTFDGDKWSQPESVLKLGKNDLVSDYQVVMADGDVLAAAIILPADKDKPELRYFSKKKGQPVKQTYTDTYDPVSISLDMVGTNPTIAILHRVDSANCDIFVKQVDMEGNYSGLGTALTIARYNPESVKVVVDKDAADAYPTDFAVVWKCADRIIRRDGKEIRTDSTQMMLNCSRMYMLENMTATPYITLGCTADSTEMSGYDVYMDELEVATLYTLTDQRNGKTYLMKDALTFVDDFEYSISPSQEVIDDDIIMVNVNVQNTGATPITYLEGWINNQHFYFNDIVINPYSTQQLPVEYYLELDDDYSGLLKAHDVTAVFEDKWSITKVSRRGAPRRTSIKSEDSYTEYAAGQSDLKCELLSQTINGTENKVFLELTDYDELNANETVHVGLYTDRLADVPISSTAEVLLKASDFTTIGGERKAWVELTVDGLTEAVDVEVRARVYNDKVLEALGDDDSVNEAVVDNLSWQDNQRIITLLPSELDDVTGMPVVSMEQRQHKVTVEQTPEGIWISGLEEGDFVRIFDAGGRPAYQQSRPTSRLFVPMQDHGVYLLSTGQEIVKFTF